MSLPVGVREDYIPQSTFELMALFAGLRSSSIAEKATQPPESSQGDEYPRSQANKAKVKLATFDEGGSIVWHIPKHKLLALQQGINSTDGNLHVNFSFLDLN